MADQLGSLPINVLHEETDEVSRRPNALPYQFVGRLKSATPSVLNLTRLVCSGDTVTITDFLEGQEGQEIQLIGDGTTTIDNNANIKTPDGSPMLLDEDMVYSWTLESGVWKPHFGAGTSGGGGGSGSGTKLPFFNADGSEDDIDLVVVGGGNELPFYNADGSQDNIAMI